MNILIKYAVVFFSGILALNSFAIDLPEGVKMENDGTFRYGNAEFHTGFYDTFWKGAKWSKTTIQSNDSRQLVVRRELIVNNVSGCAVETVKSLSPTRFSIKYECKFEKPVSINTFEAVVQVPRDQLKNVECWGKLFPIDSDKPSNRFVGGNSLTINLSEGRILTIERSYLNVFLKDLAHWGGSWFQFCFVSTGKDKTSDLFSYELTFTTGTVEQQNVNLGSSVNRGFADEYAEDGKGGWTDQGPGNDLHMLKPGLLQNGVIRFQIIDPSVNNGKGTIVLAGETRSNTCPREITIPLPEFENARAINLLHAAAWSMPKGANAGEIEITYANGEKQKIPVKYEVDINNWWSPVANSNAFLFWEHENATVKVGLYASSFTLTGKNPVNVTFRTLGEIMWMIPAVTLSDRPLTFAMKAQNPIRISAGEKWLPLNFQSNTVKGSPLDFSFIQDAPAGKYGRIVPNKNGDLVFEKEPEKKIRLYGVNLVGDALFLTKSDADELAERLARCGYNSVRFHHHDGPMTEGTVENSVTLNSKRLDQLDYLFAVLKKRGFYIITDFYASRPLCKGDGIPELRNPKNITEIKALFPVSEAARNNLKEFIRRWMTHKNPYTGLTWGDDPALFAVNLVNEDDIDYVWSFAQDIYLKKWAEYIKRNRIQDTRAIGNNPEFLEFLYKFQMAFYKEMKRYCDKELGLPILFSGINMAQKPHMALLTQQLDIIDKHNYMSHPHFLKNGSHFPNSVSQLSPIASLGVPIPRTDFNRRIAGKPIMFTELNICHPNRFRGVGEPMLGAYAALQDWNALYRFAWAHGRYDINRVTQQLIFDGSVEPMAQLGDRIAIAMFVREDVKSANPLYIVEVPKNFSSAMQPQVAPELFTMLGLISRIGIAVEGNPVPVGTVVVTPQIAKHPETLSGDGLAWKMALKERRAVSNTGEVRIDAPQRTFSVATPRTEVVSLESGSHTADVLRIENADSPQTFAAISLDGIPLESSTSILLIHQTNILNTDCRFGNEQMTLWLDKGVLPLLVYRGIATITVKGKPCTVKALSADGKTLGPVNGSYVDGIFRFKADPGLYQGGVLAYHLTR